jgi:hypothetical protein
MAQPQNINGPFVTIGKDPERFQIDLPIILIIACVLTILFIIFLVAACVYVCKRTNPIKRASDEDARSTASNRGLINSPSP